MILALLNVFGFRIPGTSLEEDTFFDLSRMSMQRSSQQLHSLI